MFDKEEYIDYLRSEDWQERRKEIMEEADWECEQCSEKATQLHHLNYDNLGYEQLGVDVIPLCKNCHEEIHNKGGEYGEYKEWRS